MRWILAGLLAAAIAASTYTPTARVRGDNYGWEEPTLDDEAGDMTLTLCTANEAC